MSSFRRLLVAVALVPATLAPATLAAQQSAAPAAPAVATPVASRGLKPLTQDTYDAWRVIPNSVISPDGRWVAWTLTPVIGNGELVVRATTGSTEHRVARGWTGRAQLQPNADSGFTAPPPQFTGDSRHVLALTYAPQADYERARRAGRRGSEPRASLAIVNVATGQAVIIPRVKSFRVPREGGRWVAYLLEAPDTSAGRDSARRDTTRAPAGPATPVSAATPGGQPRPIADSSAARQARRRDQGTELVLRDLETGAETRIDDVTAYLFDDAGAWLGWTTAAADRSKDGAYVRQLAAGRTIALKAGAGSYRSLVFDRDGTQAAFVAGDASTKPKFALWHARLGDAAREVVASGALGAEHLVAEKGRVEFTRAGNAVLFGVASPPLDSIPADSLADKAVLDLWHWKDARLQPQQRRDAARERDRAHTAIWHVRERRAVRLGDDTLRTFTFSDDGRFALANTDASYAVENMWSPGLGDAWLVDTRTGKRTRIAERIEFNAALSPGGRYAVWFQEGRWRAYETASGRTRDLTGAIRGVRFDQETWDRPSTPAPWGLGGWTDGDRSLLVYDRWDVWDVDPSGDRPARMVTDSLGSREHIEFRVVDLDPDRRTVDPAQPILLRAFDDDDKSSGFWRDRLDRRVAPERIVMADARFGIPRRARAAEAYVVTRETMADFPDLWAGESLARLTRLSEANPQQREYAWGSVELVRWRSDDGVPLEGLLYKPAGFDPSRKYPLVTYFYEKHSDALHQYHVPAGRNVINPSVWVTLGYLVFMPDIAYADGYPGPSALKSIVPGIQSLIARGFVKEDAIASAGQSWGGYQTAYMITQTRLFRAAFAGAPVANMTSAYGGIRWESGIARVFQYERDQSRIGGSLWQYPTRFIDNSPLFHADRIETPLLMMHNDADGAVPWYQGIELFVAMRRLGKEVYLLNYNGDGHNPRKRANQKDIDLRMQQFFGHHLKGEPAPEWMQRGIPYLQKGRDQLAPASVAAEGPAAGSSPAGGAPEQRP